MNRMLVLDPDISQAMIEERKRRGIDRHDEVWEGVYVMPSVPSTAHQQLVSGLIFVLYNVVDLEESGHVYPGANVSDRLTDWKDNFRVPDVVVLLNDSRASDCDTYILGGPDFLVEIQSPGDPTLEKLPFYSQIGVRELLVLHRDTRQLTLYRHDGEELVPVEPATRHGKKWLQSEVVALAFRRKTVQGRPQTEIRRTDGKPGLWTI